MGANACYDVVLAMRRWFVKVVVPVAVLAASTGGASAVEAGAAAPQFVLPDLRGESISLAKFRRDVVLINFWATWCGPCRDELPALEALQQRFAAKGFEVIGVNLDSQAHNARDFVTRLGISYTVLLDPQFAAASDYGADTMPISYLVDRDGRVRQVFNGFSKKKLPLMESAVAALVAEETVP
jgi:peroxiredoxin